MKKILFFFLLLTAMVTSATPIHPIKVDERIQKLFAETFPRATEISWNGSDTYVEVFFRHEGAWCRITYNTDGTIHRTERYYTGDHLSPYVLARVKRKYPSYAVYGVTEVTTEGGVVYYLVLEGAQKWLRVAADNTGASYILQRFNRPEAALPLTSQSNGH